MESSKWTVYCHTHIDSGRKYIGLTSQTWQKRWKNHVYDASKQKRSYYFLNAIHKYGKDAFEHEVLEMCNTIEEANLAERKWIKRFDSTNPEKGFNILTGGNHAYTDNIKERMSIMQKEINARPGFIERKSAISKAALSKPEIKQKISVAMSGRNFSPEHRAKISSNMKAYYSNPENLEAKKSALTITCSSPEWRNKQRMSRLGTKTSEETKVKLRASNRSGEQEIRAKISKTSKAYYANPENRKKTSEKLKEYWAEKRLSKS